MEIQVTQEDIDYGVREDISACPIARAIKRQFPDSKVWVAREFVQIDEKIYWTKTETEEFVCNFDEGKQVKPFTFNLVWGGEEV